MTGYRPPIWLRNGHINTIVGGRLRKVPPRPVEHQRITTPDDDFLDLQWYREDHSRLAVLCHGLEGSANRCYMRGMARALQEEAWDVLAWSYRGCSGEPNRRLRSYHSGETEDLGTVLSHTGRYSTVVLVGFSLGGNVVLKYLGEQGADCSAKAGVAISVPCDLAAGAAQLAQPANRLYMARFMRNLKGKMRQKIAQFPGQVSDEGLDRMTTFAEFDGAYTAPIHGFASAEDYWTRCSSKAFLSSIRVPALIVNAQDDPFLPEASYPVQEAAANPMVALEMPRYGGHVGFVAPGRYWSERRAAEFLAEVIG